MVCVYCKSTTQVVNSRHQKRSNQIWRRRRCSSCQAVFTTLEAADTEQAFRVAKQNHLEPFSRDKLLLTIHDSLRHRKTAQTDATALTDTVLGKLYPQFTNGVIEPKKITEITLGVLKNFDQAAATHYQAFHPE